MNNTTSLTPLESYFLVKLLNNYGFLDGAFNRISVELKGNTFVREQDGYDAARLSPELLQEFALQLLREELIREPDVTEQNGNGGGVSPTPRKRKLPNTPLPTLKEAQEQYHKLPPLIDRLYTLYLDHTVRAIREDEAKIEVLKREISDEIVQGETAGKDASKREPKALNANGTPTANDTKGAKPVRPNGPLSQTPIPVPTPQLQSLPSQSTAVPAPVAPTPAPPPAPDRTAIQPAQSPLPSNVRPSSEIRQVTPIARPNDPSKPPNGASSVLQHPQTAQVYGAPPGPATPQHPPADGLQIPDSLPRGQSPVPRPSPQPQAQTPGTLKWEPLYRPQQTPVPSPRPPYSTPTARQSTYPGQPSTGHPQPPPPQAHAANRQTPQPNAQPTRLSAPGTSQSSQPVLLPPQNSGQLPPSLASLPFNATPDGSGQQSQQYRSPSVPVTSAPNTAVPVPNFAQQHQQPPSTLQHQPGQAPVRPPGAATKVQTPGHSPTGPLPTGHRPPLTGPASQAPHGQTLPSVPSVPTTPVPQRVEGATKLYSSPYHGKAQPTSSLEQAQRPNVQGIPSTRPPATSLLPSHQPSLPQTPLALNTSSHVIRGHGTKWTSNPTPSTPRLEMTDYFDTQSPAFEPLSPPRQTVSLPKPTPQQTERNTRRNTPKIDPSVTKPKSRLSRSAQKAVSATSHADGTSEDQDTGRKIKDEVATPKPFEYADDTTVDESIRDKLHSTTISRASNKRKRQESPENRAPPAPATHVYWTRSFHKVSASALEQVTSHRHANMFANPVKARDAPGYPDIILRPQDLKGIRAAINQGQRAAQAAEKNLSDADPTAMTVKLPISIDLIPPKGIVNIAQLERELVHMFANAIMYAPDPDPGVGPEFLRSPDSEDDNKDVVGYEVDENGIVKETRNMFGEVEKLLGDLRNEVERSANPPAGGPVSVSRSMSVAGGSTVEDDIDEQAGDTDAPSTAKRRRVRG